MTDDQETIYGEIAGEITDEEFKELCDSMEDTDPYLVYVRRIHSLYGSNGVESDHKARMTALLFRSMYSEEEIKTQMLELDDPEKSNVIRDMARDLEQEKDTNNTNDFGEFMASPIILEAAEKYKKIT